MNTSAYLLCFITAYGFLSLGACEAPQTEHAADKQRQTKPTPIGQSWVVIDAQDKKAIWHRVQTPTENTNFVPFETQAAGSDKQSFDRLEISITSQDRVFVTRRDKTGEIYCTYKGRVWVESDLGSYEAFHEDTTANDRPKFYHIVTGTYSCSGMDEPGSWAAKINK